MKKITLFSILFLIALLPFLEQPTYADTNYHWYFDATNTTRAHSQNIKGQGVKILVIDDGIDKTHSELENLVNDGRLIFEDGVQEEDLFDKNNPFPHGTAMVSFIAGKTLGIAPESTIFFSKNFTDTNRNIESMTDSIQWGIDNDVDIISMSVSYSFLEEHLSEPDNTLLSLHSQLETKIQEAKNKGILFISSAGNIAESECYGDPFIPKECGWLEENDKEREITFQQNYPMFSLHVGATDASIQSIAYPAKFPETFAVGGIKQLEDNPNLYERSNTWLKEIYPNDEWQWYASATGNELDIVGPGTNVTYAMPNSFKEILVRVKKYVENNETPLETDTPAYEKYKDTYQNFLDDIEDHPKGDFYHQHFGGTSSATAITAGIAALYKQIYPTITAYELEKMLLDNANSENIVNDDEYFDNQFGEGFVQAPVIDGLSLFHNVNNRLVLNKGVYTPYAMFDQNPNSWQDTEYSSGDSAIYRFERPITVKASSVEFDDSLPLKEINLTFYDSNRNVLNSQGIVNSGLHLTEEIKNVFYVEFKNISGDRVDIREFDLLGDYSETSIGPKKYNSTIEMNGTTYSTNLAENWDDINKHFDRFSINVGTETSPYYQFLTLKDYKVRIYKEDLTNTVNGKIVKDGGVGYEKEVFDDQLNYADFYPNSYIDYEFDIPVSLSNLYIENLPDYLNNQLEVTFYNSLGYPNTISIGDDELFERYFDLEKTYENVKKIRIKNTHPTQNIRIQEVGFYGKYPETKAHLMNVYNKSLTLKAGNYVVSDDPIHPIETSITIDTYFLANIRKGYNLKYDEGIFEWIEVKMPSGEYKWVNTNQNKITDKVFQNGLIDTLFGVIVEKNRTWDTDSMHNNELNNYPEIYEDDGFVRYQFNQTTSVNSLYINLHDYIDNRDHNFTIQFLDSNQNIISEISPTRDDLYKEFIELPQEVQQVNGIKIVNNGNDRVRISELELYK